MAKPSDPMTEADFEDIDILDLRGRHTHLRPRCFRDVVCESDCGWSRELYSSPGVPACHPAVCDDCLVFVASHENHGSGI